MKISRYQQFCAPVKIVVGAGLFVSFLVGLLTACSSNPGLSDIPGGSEFTAHILEDGSKQFVLKVRVRGGSKDERMESRDAGDNCFPCAPGEQRAGFRDGDRDLDLKRVAKAMLAENQYCREGFVALEQYREGRAQILRGECRDTATAADRTRFARTSK